MGKQASPHHLLECDLHQVFESFVRVLLCGLLDEAALQHVNHLLSGDVVVTVHVVHLKAVWAVKIKVINLDNCRTRLCVWFESLHLIFSSKVPRRKMESPFIHSLTQMKLSLSLSNALKTEDIFINHNAPHARYQRPSKYAAFPFKI